MHLRRRLLAAALFLALTLLLARSAPRTLAAEYELGALVDDAAKNIAPPPLQRAMARLESKRLRDTAETHQLSERALATYFSAIPVDLGRRPSLTYLVYPSQYSTHFFGAHAISFWLLEQRPDGSLHLLLSYADDRLRILPERTHGLSDLYSFYGTTRTTHRFDGKVYQSKER